MKRTSIWVQKWSAGIIILSLTFLRNEFRFGVTKFGSGSDLFVQKSTAEVLEFEVENAIEEMLFPRLCREVPEEPPIWEWKYANESLPAKYTPKNRMLIATYSAFGTYARVLELTAPINKAYAKLWGQDLVVLQGTTMILPWDVNCTPTEERSRFNKVDLLLTALQHREYDLLLLLDADTLVYNFTFDISAMMPDGKMLVAQRTKQEDPPATRNINNGVTLWNLRHSMTKEVAVDWDRRCRNGIPDNRPFRGDQYYLRATLKPEERVREVSAVWNEFYYRDATVVKHFQRSNNRSWNETGLDVREARIENATQEILSRYGLDLGYLEVQKYTENTGDVTS